ncbi:adenosylcobinamide-GDP ribazoletransferase [Oxalobacteraceae bacterium CAVE-383]|nr:adenosylcobinamide-GDP ribazoletransferase [Oxalobacteraceae bacterium CAVE-383]
MRRKAVHELRLFFLALQFFTRLPIPRWVGFDAAWQRHAIRYFPAAGLLVGIVASAVYALAMLFWPPVVAVLLAVGAGLWITGAMHEDGLADTCDGLGAGGGAERILRIMRDSHTGVFGVLGLIMALALKCAALTALPPHHACIALVLAHPLSRLACFPLIRKLDYLREEGKAKALAEQITVAEYRIGAATVLPLLLLIAAGGWLPRAGLLFGLLLMLLGVWWLARLFVKRIGGYTGDCLGAVQQSAEVLFYLGLAAALRI